MLSISSDLETLNFALKFNQSKKRLEYSYQKPLAEVFREFIRNREHVKNCSESSMGWYRRILKIIQNYNYQWSDLEDVDTFLSFQEYLRHNNSRTTHEKRMTYFTAFINWAHLNGYLSDNAYRIYRSNAIKEDTRHQKTSKSIFKPQKFDTLLRCAYSKDRDFYWFLTFLYLLDARVGELIHLKITDIDFRDSIVSLYQSKTRCRKYLPLPPPLLSDFQEYLLQNDKLGREFVFEGATRCDRYYSDLFKTFRKQQSLNPKYKLGQIRHFTAHAVYLKFDKETAGLILGHSSYNDTTSRYLGEDYSKKRKVIKYLCSYISYLAKYVSKNFDMAESGNRMDNKKFAGSLKTPQTKLVPAH